MIINCSIVCKSKRMGEKRMLKKSWALFPLPSLPGTKGVRAQVRRGGHWRVGGKHQPVAEYWIMGRVRRVSLQGRGQH